MEDKFGIRDSRTASTVVVIHRHPVEVWRNKMGPPSAETGEKLEGGGPIRFVDMIGAAMAAQQQQHQKQQQQQQQKNIITTPSSSGRVDRVSKIDLSVKIEEDSVDEEDEEMQEAQEAAVDHPLPPPPTTTTTTTTMIIPTSSKVSESDEGVLKVSKHWVSAPATLVQETKEEQQQAVMHNNSSLGGFRSYGDGQGNTTVFRDIKALSASLVKSNNDNNIVHGKSSTERGSTVEDGSPPSSPLVSLSGSAASQLQAEVIHTFKNLKDITSCEIGRTVDVHDDLGRLTHTWEAGRGWWWWRRVSVYCWLF